MQRTSRYGDGVVVVVCGGKKFGSDSEWESVVGFAAQQMVGIRRQWAAEKQLLLPLSATKL